MELIDFLPVAAATNYLLKAAEKCDLVPPSTPFYSRLHAAKRKYE